MSKHFISRLALGLAIALFPCAAMATPTVAQHGINSISAATFAGTYATTPANGDTLIAITFSSANTPTAPTGWTSHFTGQYLIFSGVVGSGGLTAATSYNFESGTDSGLIDMFDISSGGTLTFGTQYTEFGSTTGTASINVTAGSSSGLLLAYSYDHLTSTGRTPAFTPPSGQTLGAVDAVQDFAVSTEYYTMVSNKSTTDPSTATQPYTATSAFTGGAAYFNAWITGLIFIAAGGAAGPTCPFGTVNPCGHPYA
jgi:hypothetical protein